MVTSASHYSEIKCNIFHSSHYNPQVIAIGWLLLCDKVIRRLYNEVTPCNFLLTIIWLHCASWVLHCDEFCQIVSQWNHMFLSQMNDIRRFCCEVNMSVLLWQWLHSVVTWGDVTKRPSRWLYNGDAKWTMEAHMEIDAHENHKVTSLLSHLVARYKAAH